MNSNCRCRVGKATHSKEFNAILDDVDVTRLERGFDEICNQTASDGESSSGEEESSGHGNIVVTEVVSRDKEHADDEACPNDVGGRYTPVAHNYDSVYLSDAASDASVVDSASHQNERQYPRPYNERESHRPGI